MLKNEIKRLRKIQPSKMAKQTLTKYELYNIFLKIPKPICDIIYNFIGNPFIFTLNISLSTHNKIISIPVIATTSNSLIIDWGDGVSEHIKTLRTTCIHVYSKEGVYIVHIYMEILLNCL